MELRDPENHEAGDSEVRDQRWGGRDRAGGMQVGGVRDGCRQRATQRDGRGREMETSKTQSDINPRRHRKPRPLEKCAQKQRTENAAREEGAERWLAWGFCGLRRCPQLGLGASGGSHRWQGAGSLETITHSPTRT